MWEEVLDPMEPILLLAGHHCCPFCNTEGHLGSEEKGNGPHNLSGINREQMGRGGHTRRALRFES